MDVYGHCFNLKFLKEMYTNGTDTIIIRRDDNRTKVNSVKQYGFFMKGVYVLILKLDQETDIQIGKLGKLHFRKGFYAYTGSALGTGGFKRVERHFNVATGKNPTRKWHIDYLLPKSKIVHAILLPTEDAIECELARRLRKISGISIISGFGCTDCYCETHLIYAENELKGVILDVCDNIGIKSIIINNESK